MGFAVVFPGQGSQSVGMLAELAESEPLVGEIFAAAEEVLERDLWTLSRTGPAEALTDTRVTQPLMFIADIAVWRVLESRGLPTPAAFAGHSLGEFAALTASGALDFESALRLVDRRSTLMAGAVADGEGGMAALIGMDDEAVVALCAETAAGFGEGQVVEAVNFNAPGQVAISGHLRAVEAVVAVAREHGARKALMLPVSVPNHSSLMRAAGAALAEAIDALAAEPGASGARGEASSARDAAGRWRMPAAPLVQNAPARAPDTLDALLASLREHVYSPVRWTDSIARLRDAHGVATVLEVGPGRVLSGLGKRIDRSLPTLAVDSPETLNAALDAVGVAA